MGNVGCCVARFGVKTSEGEPGGDKERYFCSDERGQAC